MRYARDDAVIRRVSRWLEWLLVDTHLWVSLAAACLTFFVATTIVPSVRLASTAIVFSATLLIYAVDDVFDGRMSTQPLRWCTVTVGALSLAVQLLLAPALTALVVALGALPALIYAAPIAGRRLRELAFVKPFFVALSLTIAVLAVPVLLAWERHDQTVSIRPVLVLAALLFPLILCNVCFFDLRDRGADASQGIRTIPVRLGAMGTRVLCLALCLSVAMVAVMTEHVAVQALLLAAGATAAYAMLLPTGARRLAYALAVDGAPVLLGVAVLLQ